jgi:hypothetical protein
MTYTTREITRATWRQHGGLEMQEHSEAQARRAAKRVGLIAKKGGRWRRGSIDNFGDFMLVDPYRNFVVAGPRFNMTADEVVEFCAEYEAR